MNLPNYFLADLPPAAVPSPTMIEEACRTLKRNRERYLAPRNTDFVIHLLASVAKNWLQQDYPLRKAACEQGQVGTGFSRATIHAGLDAFFRQITEPNLRTLIEQDLGHVARLDQLVSTESEQRAGRAAVVTAPELLVHIAAGNLPNPTLMSMILGLLLRSAQFVKCATGSSAIPRLFAHSIYECDPKVASCLEVAEWRGGKHELEPVLFSHANCVTATGSDHAIAHIRAALPAHLRFLSYGHKVSFGYVSAEVLQGSFALKIVERAAADVIAWNQLGCLSPHVIYVENGGGIEPENFAELLAKRLAELESSDPRGELPVASSAAIASRRSIYELRAAASADTRLWASPGSTAWTVVYEANPRFQVSCLNRFVYVKSVPGLEHALQQADELRTKVSTVGLAVPEHKAQHFALLLARWGVGRVCPLGNMQNPPFTWRHDGRPALGDLVTWTDWES